MVAAGSITVAVRVRPPSTWEAARLPEPCYDSTIRGDGALSTPGKATNSSCIRDIVQIIDDRILTFDPEEKDRVRSFVERGFMPPGTKRYKDRRFMFDRVFNHEAKQQDVYDSTAQPLLNNLLDGYNATIFAYGATGCGKTHTISGTDTDPGVIYLTMADLFQRIEDRKDEYNVEVMVTFLEIYNEEIRDLLAESGSYIPRGGLSIREDKSVKVVGLVELRPTSAEEVKEIVLQGNLRRTQSPTHANATSSRSHAVLQVHVTQSPRTASVTEQRTMGTLSIIDLAGSERAAATNNMGQRMVEGANINKSLLALGNCINALCESGGAVRHVPYRNSKLTRLLKFSLGGNCKTVMIVCVAPTSNHFDDTHNTLVYAERATKIKTRVVTRNVVNVDRHVGQYVEAINRLNAEVAELKAKLSGQNQTESDIARRKKAEAAAEVQRARTDMDAKMEQTRASMVDGAVCTGLTSVATAKVSAAKARLNQIDAMGPVSSLPSDVAAERALLESLIAPDEEVLRTESTLRKRAQRSANSAAMFDATMRAVSERRSNRLDEASINTIKLDAKWRRAEVDRLKAVEEANVLRDAVESMSKVMVNLVGMMGRSTIMLGDSATALNRAGNQDSQDQAEVGQVASLLDSIKGKNDDLFMKLIGQSTEQYFIPESSLDLSRLNGYGSNMGNIRRVTSGPATLQKPSTSRSRTRESSTIDANMSTSATPIRSPRRSNRASRASLAPYRRVSEKEKKSMKSSKNVQWKDEAGQGDLVDGNISLNIIAASPAPTSASSSSSNILTPNTQRSSSVGQGSESEWEDEIEKTDESIDFFTRSLPASTHPRDSLSSSYGGYGTTGAGGKRPRPSRLDPSFLKTRSRGASALGSLAEGDESSMDSPRRPSQPLGDRNMNAMDDDLDSISHGARKAPGGSLHIPKNKDRQASPTKRVPPTPRSGSSSSLGRSVNGRRRSGVGMLQRSRRRSSQIPQLSPAGSSEGTKAPRRVLIASPAKKKRSSFSKAGSGSARLRSGSVNISFADTTSEAISAGGKSKPLWK